MRYVLRQVAIYMAAAAAFMAQFVTALVWDAGQWVRRLVRSAAAGPQQAAQAEMELVAEEQALQQEARAPEPQRMSDAEMRRFATDFGMAALAYLAGDDAQRAKALDGIDPAAAAYLDSLSLEQAKKLLAVDPIHVAAHLIGSKPIAGLPPYTQSLVAKSDRLRADTETLRRTREASERQREAEYAPRPAFA